MLVASAGNRPVDDGPLDELDLLIGGLGFERRSRQIPEAFRDTSRRTVLIDLRSPGQGSYDENRQVAEDSGFELLAVEPSHLSRWVVDAFAELSRRTSTPHVGFDISSLPRDWMARVVEGLSEVDHARGANGERAIVDILYTPATPPDQRMLPGPERIEVLGPVTSRFAGFAPDPSSPVVAFVGLGIEQDRAIGALEYIEPATTWIFIPFGEDESFDNALRDANTLVWPAVAEEQRVEYRVDDPFWLYETLERLVLSVSATGRPIFVPLGPKIFAACSLLVASQNPRAGVWRVTPGRYGKVRDCESAGKLIELRVELGPTGAFASRVDFGPTRAFSSVS